MLHGARDAGRAALDSFARPLTADARPLIDAPPPDPIIRAPRPGWHRGIVSRAALLFASLLLGCASTVGGTYTQEPDGSVAADARALDATQPTDTRPAVDVTSACVAEPSIDGDARAQVDGLDARFVVHAAEMAPGRPRFDDEGCGPRAGGTHAFSLRFTALRRAWLRVSVESPVGGGVTDRLVIARGCGAASTRIACAGAIEAPRARAFESNAVTVRTREPVEAGETVTLSVGAAPSDVVVRVVSVVVERAIGAACDPDEGRDVCSQHGRCVRGACLPEGVLESTCRDGASPCDAGLSCVGATAAGPRGVCMRRVAAGAPCVIGDACEGGLCEAAAGASVCRPLGAYLNRCRATEPRCDAPLGCVRAAGEIVERCHRVLASGAACTDDTGRAGVCPSGESCRVSADGRRCARHGAEGGACRSALPVCDAGLACGFSGGEILCLRDASIGTRGGRCGSSPLARCAQGLACDLTTSRCVDALPAAAACSLETQTCAAGLTCGLLAGRPRGEARCVAPGGEGGACRSLAPSCDAGLVCARPPMSRCVRPLPFDALCDSFDTTRACDGECVGGRCRPFGTRGGPCRDVGDACGEGLACGAVRSALISASGSVVQQHATERRSRRLSRCDRARRR